MEKFKSFITEEEKPFRFINLIHDTPDDPNKTGDALVKQAKKMGIDCYQLRVENGYFTENEKGNLVAHNFIEDKDVVVMSDKSKTIKHDEKGWEIDPENTLCFLRVAVGRGVRLAEQVRLYGVKTINSRFTHMICDDKWLNYLAMKNAGLRQPRTAILTHFENLDVEVCISDRPCLRFAANRACNHFSQKLLCISQIFILIGFFCNGNVR